jgi:hypothetical protein
VRKIKRKKIDLYVLSVVLIWIKKVNKKDIKRWKISEG